MATRVQKQKPAPQKAKVEQTEPAKTEAEILDITDELLDEIDALLEEDAQAFVAAFVQKGGE